MKSLRSTRALSHIALRCDRHCRTVPNKKKSFSHFILNFSLPLSLSVRPPASLSVSFSHFVVFLGHFHFFFFNIIRSQSSRHRAHTTHTHTHGPRFANIMKMKAIDGRELSPPCRISFFRSEIISSSERTNERNACLQAIIQIIANIYVKGCRGHNTALMPHVLVTVTVTMYQCTRTAQWLRENPFFILGHSAPPFTALRSHHIRSTLWRLL